ncbi:MAG: 7TM-DISM domain-containing protein, partial [Acidobacteriota bacterium]
MSDWRPESDGPTQLSGTWDFYWRQLLSPGDDPEGGAAPITVPSFWHRTAVAPDATAGRGFGTYRLRVKLPPDRPALAVRLGNVNTAVEVFANGLSIWRVGRVAEDLEGSVPGYRPGVAPLPPIDDPILDLVVQVSSHETDRGGLDEPVWLGRTEDLLQARSRELTLLGLLAGGLLTMGIYYLCHFAVRRRSEVSLYFGLFCLAAVGRLMCTHELLVLEIWPEIPWSLVAKGAYFFTFAIVCAFVLHLQALWPSRVPAWFFRFVFSSAGLAGAVVLATPPSLFTRTLIFLQAYVVVCVVLSVVVFASAVRSRAEGLGLYAGGFLFV